MLRAYVTEPWTEICMCSSLLNMYVFELLCVTFVGVFWQGVINLESLGKRGYRVPPSGTIQVVRNLFRFYFSPKIWKLYEIIYTCIRYIRYLHYGLWLREMQMIQWKGRLLVDIQGNCVICWRKEWINAFMILIFKWQQFSYLHWNCIIQIICSVSWSLFSSYFKACVVLAFLKALLPSVSLSDLI